jgi:hypothetical protein
MKKLLSFAAFAAALSAVTLNAEDRAWRFKPGMTWKYECRSHYAFGTAVRGGDTRPQPGWDGSGDPPTTGGTGASGRGSTVPGDPRDTGGRTGQNGGGSSGPTDPRDSAGRGGERVGGGESRDPRDSAGRGGEQVGGADMPGDPRDRGSSGSGKPEPKSDESGGCDGSSGGGSSSGGGGKPRSGGDTPSEEGEKDPPNTPTDGAKPGDEPSDSSSAGVEGAIEQEEVVQLTALVLAVGDDGSARVRFTVNAVRVEIRSGETGIRLSYNSATDKNTDYAGFKPFQALVGHVWTSLIDADGSVLESEGEAWPAAEAAPKAKKGDEKKANVARAAMPPTAARAWADMIFATAPDGKLAKRTLNFGVRDETLEIQPVRDEVARTHVCLRSDLRTKARFLQLGGAPPVNASPARRAHQAAQIAEKRGLGWFSRKSACTMRAELRGRGNYEAGRAVQSGDLGLTVDLKHIGWTELTPTGDPVETGK